MFETIVWTKVGGPSMIEPPKMGFAFLWKTPKFGPNSCLTNNFLHCEFQLSMFSSWKVLFWEGIFGKRFWSWAPKDPRIWSKQLSHKTTSFIMSFNFLC